MGPDSAILRWDLALTTSEFDAEMNRRKYIGHRVFPPLQVGLQNAKFNKLKAASLMPPIEDTLRAPDGSYKRQTGEWTSDQYATDDYGVEETIDDRKSKIYRGMINLETAARNRGIQRVAQAYEDAAATLAFANSNTSAVATPWSTKATADPIGDIDAKREIFIAQCGHSPNALVMEEKAYIAMIRTDRVEDLLKYSGRDDPKMLLRMAPQLAELLNIEQIIVAQAPLKNTAGRGKDATFGRIWDQTKVLMARISNAQDIEEPVAQLGRTVMWSEDGPGAPGAGDEGIAVVVEDYRENRVRGGVVRVRTDYELKVFHEQAGLVLTGVTA